jgi:hypothetical protein
MVFDVWFWAMQMVSVFWGHTDGFRFLILGHAHGFGFLLLGHTDGFGFLFLGHA